MGKCIIVGGFSNANAGTGATNYASVARKNAGLWSTTEDDTKQIVPCSGRASNFQIVASGAPGAAKSYDLTIRKNKASTSLTCNITGAAQTTQIDKVNEVTFAAGDFIDIMSVPTGTPTARTFRWSLDFEPDSDRFVPIIGGSENALNTAAVTQNHIGGGTAWAADAATNVNHQVPFITSGVIKNMYIAISAAAGALSNWIFSPLQNGFGTALTATLADPATTGNDTTHSFNVSVNDLIELQATPNVVPPAAANAYYGMVFLSNKDNECYASGSCYTAMAAGTNYVPINSANQVPNSLAARVMESIRASRVSGLYVKMGANTDVGQTCQFTVYKNGSATALTCTVGSASNTATDTTNFIEFDDLDSITLQVLLSAGTAATFAWAVKIEPLYPYPNARMMSGMGV